MSTPSRPQLTVAALALVPAAFVWRGYALATLWGWFIVPQFGAPPLGIAQAIGVSLVIGSLTHQRQPENAELTLFRIVADGMVLTALTLCLGWIIKGFL